MHSLDPAFLDRQSITRQPVRTVREVGVLRGTKALYRQQPAQVLETLWQVAASQNTKSSNRIEGGVAPPRRIREIVQEKATPANQSEQEIAGYRDFLSTIHANCSDMRLTSGLVRQLHRDLYRFTSQPGDDWRTAGKENVERHLRRDRANALSVPRSQVLLSWVDGTRRRTPIATSFRSLAALQFALGAVGGLADVGHSPCCPRPSARTGIPRAV